MQGIDRNCISKTIFIYFLIDQTERMGEHAPTLKELLNLVALAHSSLLVNAVKMIFVNFIHVKIMGLVLLILLMAKKHQHATVLKILLDQIVTCCFAVPMMYLVIMVVHAKSTQLAMKTFGSTIQIWNVLWNYWILESRKVVNAFKRMD